MDVRVSVIIRNKQIKPAFQIPCRERNYDARRQPVDYISK